MGMANTVYFLFEAKTIPEYVNSFYIAISQWTVLIDFGLSLSMLPNILNLIENYENFIEKSKCNTEMFSSLNQFIFIN